MIVHPKHWAIVIVMDLVAYTHCLLYTSDAADEEDSVDLGGRRINTLHVDT